VQTINTLRNELHTCQTPVGEQSESQTLLTTQ